MEKEIGKSFSAAGFKPACLPGWMNNFAKKMAVFVASGQKEKPLSGAGEFKVRCIRPMLVRVSSNAARPSCLDPWETQSPTPLTREQVLGDEKFSVAASSVAL